MRVTQSLGREDNNADRFAARSEQYRDARLRSQQLMSIYFASSQLLSTVAKALTLWYGARLIDQGTLSSGVLIAFLLYLDQFFSPLQQLSAVFDQWIQARISLGRLDELLATPSATPEPVDPIDAGRHRGSGAVATGSLRVLRRVRPRRFAASTCRSSPVRRWPSSARPAPASPRSSSSSPASTTRPRATVLVDGIDLREIDLHAYPPAHRLRAAGAVPVLRHDPLEHRLRAPAGHGPRGRARRPRRRRPRPRGLGCPRATSPRSPRPAARCPPGSSSCCASPGPSSSTRAS